MEATGAPFAFESGEFSFLRSKGDLQDFDYKKKDAARFSFPVKVLPKLTRIFFQNGNMTVF